MAGGKFIALEGPKGVGKTALCATLAIRLSPLMRDHVIITKEPTPGFDLHNEQTLQGIDLARAIAADRRMHVAEVIVPALALGKSIVCDRYILSSYIFHIGDGVAPAVIGDLNRSFPLPSVNLILHARPEVICKRRTLRGQTTRLQARDPEREFAEYIHYAKVMKSLGTLYEICDNSNQEAQQAIVYRLLRLLCTRDWNA